jgi:hypothetical protein
VEEAVVLAVDEPTVRGPSIVVLPVSSTVNTLVSFSLNIASTSELVPELDADPMDIPFINENVSLVIVFATSRLPAKVDVPVVDPTVKISSIRPLPSTVSVEEGVVVPIPIRLFSVTAKEVDPY